MIATVRRVLREIKKPILPLIILFIVTSLVETLGIGAVLPYMHEVFQGANGRIFQFVNHYLSMSVRQFTILFSAVLLLIYLLKNVFLFFSYYHIKRFVYSCMTKLKSRLFRGFLDAPYEFHISNNSSTLVSNVVYDAQQFSMNVVETLLYIVFDSVLILLLAGGAAALAPGIVGAIVGVGVLFYAFYVFSKNRVYRYGKIGSERNEQIVRDVSQGLLGIKVVKIHDMSNVFQERVEGAARDQQEVSAKYYSLQTLPRLSLEMLVVVAFVSYVIATPDISKSVATAVPVLSALILAIMRVMPSANRLVSSFSNLKNSEFIANKIERLLDQSSDFEKNADVQSSGKTQRNFRNRITLSNLTFVYPGTSNSVLKNLDFVIQRDSSIGIIGRSGAGKTTLIDIILGLLRPTEGQVLVDGISIWDDIESWRKMVGYVPQQIYLFDGSIRENISLYEGDHALNESNIWEAIGRAQLSEFVRGLPEGLDTPIGENGIRLSGGQRQRIGIARELIRNPQLLVFDEATSALDDETEKAITESIASLSHNVTLLIVAHRKSTLQFCDSVYKIVNGCLEAASVKAQ